MGRVILFDTVGRNVLRFPIPSYLHNGSSKIVKIAIFDLDHTEYLENLTC